MGAWSHEPFGNDDANDWAYDLEGTTDFSHIEAALDDVLDADDYLDSSEASAAVGAVEVLAKMLGKGTQADAYTEKVDAWVKAMGGAKPPAALLAKARKALERILGKDWELWEEGGAAAWKASIQALQAAVGG